MAKQKSIGFLDFKTYSAARKLAGNIFLRCVGQKASDVLSVGMTDAMQCQ